MVKSGAAGSGPVTAASNETEAIRGPSGQGRPPGIGGQADRLRAGGDRRRILAADGGGVEIGIARQRADGERPGRQVGAHPLGSEGERMGRRTGNQRGDHLEAIGGEADFRQVRQPQALPPGQQHAQQPGLQQGHRKLRVVDAPGEAAGKIGLAPGERQVRHRDRRGERPAHPRRRPGGSYPAQRTALHLPVGEFRFQPSGGEPPQPGIDPRQQRERDEAAEQQAAQGGMTSGWLHGVGL